MKHTSASSMHLVNCHVLLQVRESQKQRTDHCRAKRQGHVLAAGLVENPASAQV